VALAAGEPEAKKTRLDFVTPTGSAVVRSIGAARRDSSNSASRPSQVLAPTAP
jgi:hypothetical protein